ncbi:PPE domain-containing protein [Actinokineospora sp. NBRC 105648]|uniref:PPE domain-containing protein n=1 Tax=Actinokineospora sp. NBRC 105648 TaxID=3032206 RepID=UPI0024A3ECDF|nr:PPE domain-containing protein [Actinokineospora sp. NBRC 105648]GLZ38562.1 hypothetical protein Acsp05_21860 [Actinokineospora sp. NBRC 105648]
MTEQATDAKRWRGFTHKELYLMLHDGPGAQASADPSRRWAQLTAALADISHDLGNTLDSSSAVWAGRAAGAAQERLTPLATWAQAASDNAAEMRAAVENQGDYIAKARADMPRPEDVPAPQPDPAVPPAAQVVAVQVDAEPLESAQSAGEQKAFEVMAAYELSTTTNLSVLTGFTAPAELLGVRDQHRNRGDGIESTHSSFAPGHVNVPAPGHDQRHRPPGYHGVGVGGGGSDGGHFGGVGGRGQGVGLSGAAFTEQAEVVRRPVVQPGMLSGATPMNEVPYTGPGARNGVGSSDEERARRGSGAGGSRGVGGGQYTGGADALSANSSGAAAPGMSTAANTGAGAPMAPGAGAGAGMGGNDKMAMRRFGVDALGSSQWFGDAPDQAGTSGGSGSSGTRQVGGRRRDLSETEQVTESVDVLGEDVQLPPGVIGG